MLTRYGTIPVEDRHKQSETYLRLDFVFQNDEFSKICVAVYSGIDSPIKA